ncbi:hypothetical protein F2P81_003749 [Scophthalmus maximus]|uniref:Uncharacterized protein n=1 Tax=Scophthalmus maximus TaxID=52904 RepID=A0A6A4TPA4_SCOMX|nr:hypothetical protein F2P81_003749 [Scophthalmus maximus]
MFTMAPRSNQEYVIYSGSIGVYHHLQMIIVIVIHTEWPQLIPYPFNMEFNTNTDFELRKTSLDRSLSVLVSSVQDVTTQS